MKRGRTYDWLPLWRQKWLMGSTRWELDPAERSVFIDFLCLAGSDDGFIRANPETPYPPEYLAGMLQVPLELLTRTIEKCIVVGKVERDKFGCLSICSWQAYQLPPRTKRWLMSGSENSDGKDQVDEILDEALKKVRAEEEGLDAKLRRSKS